MENYIFIDGKKTVLTEQQAKQIKERFCEQTTKLADVKTGETVKIAGLAFVVLEQTGEETALILEDLAETDVVFSNKNNNYSGSEVDELCNDFAEDLANAIGAENIVMHEVDLTSNDGLKDYGTIKRQASALTADRYRKYVKILDDHNPKKWWWLSTPDSTTKHQNDQWALCVSPAGNFYGDCCNCSSGVRPFCIFKSSIFVSSVS